MFRTLTLADALEVCCAMREQDRACVRAMLGEISDEAFAVNRWNTEGPAWSFLQDGEPIFIGGLSFSTPWSAVFWMVAKPTINRHSWRKLLRKTRTVLANAADPAHPQYRHRIEAHVLASWQEANELAGRLGMVFEGCRVAVGSGGEDVNVWVRIGAPKGRA
jgi:hypothetical protein